MITLRKVTTADSSLLFSWRNHPEVYRYALKPHPVDKADHERWFKAKLEDPRCHFYLALNQDSPCGSVRFDVFSNDPSRAEVSISLAPEFWGKGIATEMLLAGEKLLREHSAVRTIKATVLPSNKASLRLFEKASYQPEQILFEKKI